MLIIILHLYQQLQFNFLIELNYKILILYLEESEKKTNKIYFQIIIPLYYYIKFAD